MLSMSLCEKGWRHNGHRKSHFLRVRLEKKGYGFNFRAHDLWILWWQCNWKLYVSSKQIGHVLISDADGNFIMLLLSSDNDKLVSLLFVAEGADILLLVWLGYDKDEVLIIKGVFWIVEWFVFISGALLMVALAMEHWWLYRM